MKRRRKASFVLAGLMVAPLAFIEVGAGVTSPAGAATAVPGVTSNSITFGFISALTGPGDSTAAGQVASIQARFDEINAKGGIDGRKLKLIVKDDATSPSEDQTAAQVLMGQGVFAIINLSPVAYGSDKVLNQAGIPVLGNAADGVEWGEQPFTNMVSSLGSPDPGEPATTTVSNFIKAHGGTNVSGFAYGISPTSISAATGFATAAKHVGLHVGLLDTSIPFGSVSAGPIALSMKNANVNGAYMVMDDSTNFAILTAAKQAGVKLKAAVSATGYGQELLNDPAAVEAAQGAYFFVIGGRPVELHTPATEAFQAALKKYANFTGVPDYGYYAGWETADLAVDGLEGVAKNPTRAGFLDALHNMTAFTAGGLENPINLSLAAFGKSSTEKACSTWFLQLEGKKFIPVPANGAPTCGSALPNSDQLKAS